MNTILFSDTPRCGFSSRPLLDLMVQTCEYLSKWATNTAKAYGFSATSEIMTLPISEQGPIREQHRECQLHPLRMEPHTFFLSNFQAQLSQLYLGISMSRPPHLSPSQNLLLFSEAYREHLPLCLAYNRHSVNVSSQHQIPVPLNLQAEMYSGAWRKEPAVCAVAALIVT